MDCLDEELVHAFVRGAVSPEELADAQAHLDACAGCRRLTAMAAVDVSSPSSASGAPWTGDALRADTWGRYVLLEALGRGGMGEVLLAYDSKLHRNIALKRVRERGAPLSPEARAGLLREARAMARLAHPNVITVHDAGEMDGEVFIAMEYVRGQTLRRWLQAPRPWRDVVAMFRAAGAGLLAAHEAGLVHRDFKPDNVLVGEDGRVRVTDFGLARTEAGLGASLDGGGLAGQRAAGAVGLETGRSALSGTRGYIAPEALRGARGVQADQFSFFVALFEALHGARPFQGASLLEELSAAERGELQRGGPERRLPSWLERAMRRGLAADPAERFASMAEALDALGDGPARTRRRRQLLAALACLTCLAVAGGWWGRERPLRVCRRFEGEARAVWNADGRQRLRAAFTSSGTAQAETLFQSVASALDGWSEEWARTRVGTCVATELAGEQAPAVLALEARCLDRRRMDFEAVVGRLLRLERAQLADAVRAVAGLPAVSDCANPAALAGRDAPAADPATREKIEHLGRLLSQARADLLVRDLPSGLATAAQVEAEARAQALAEPRAEASIVLGRLRDEAGDYAAAEASLVEGEAVAMARGLDALVAEATVELVMVIGSRQRRFDEARRWQRLAEGAVERVGLAEKEAGARLLNIVGNVAAWQQRHDEALSSYQRALAIRERLYGAEHVLVADVLHNLAAERAFADQPELAMEQATRALRIREGLLGPEHRDVAASLDLLGVLGRRFGRLEEALAYAERAVAVAAAALPAEHPFQAVFSVNLGLARADVGDLRGAVDVTEYAVALQRRRLGALHPAVGATLENLAALAVLQGDFRRAIELGEAVARDFSGKAAEAMVDVAEAHRRAGHLEVARRHFSAALARLAERPEERVRVAALTGLGQCEHALGLRGQAVAHLEEALRRGAAARVLPQRLALTELALARALPDGEAARARSLAARAKPWLAASRRTQALREAEALLDPASE